MALREDMEKQGNWLFRWRSYLPLLAVPVLLIALRQARVLEYIFGDRAMDYWESLAICISFAGLAIRCLTVGFVPRGTSGRNTKTQSAKTLNTSGMYSVVRNPLYLGNFVIYFGITLFVQVWWLILMVWVGFLLYYERIIFSEEEFLRKKFGDLFVEWARKTPMLFPNFKNWKKPDLEFSFKTVIRREFTTFFSISAIFFILEVSINLLRKGSLKIGKSWVILFLISSVIYIICFILKKKTNKLNVPGR
jgi:protein-S-isoprenylcysteine O-methyltransferase Ste14